ncbi:hypothetical protein J6590_079119 [Homalodisca vitripennis]|nr:hypothetical protein J6590_079119 [Homalodisca vitripennis]
MHFTPPCSFAGNNSPAHLDPRRVEYIKSGAMLNQIDMGDYQPLRSDDAHTNNHVPVHNKPTVYYSKPMSPLRKLAFGCSILLCFITIVVFLWVVPCDWSKCPAKTQRQPIMSWDRSVEGMGESLV